MTLQKSFVLSALALIWICAAGFINPAFTPVDLVNQSQTIVSLQIKSVDKNGLVTVAVQKVIKGTLDQKELKIDLQAGVVPADGAAVARRISDGASQALLFVGLFPEGDNNQLATESKGYLHLGGQWEVVEWDDKAGTWDLDKTDDHMLGTWSGATDMLLRAVNYVLSDPQPNLPVSENVAWGDQIKIAKLDGKIYCATPVDVAGNGRPDLFIAAENGDHLFRWNGKSFDDVTAGAGLTSKSHAFAWGDFNGDGLLDLASWDGKELSIFYQGKDGKFTAKAVNVGDALKDGCIALTTVDSGNSGHPALLASTKASPVIVTIQEDGSAQAKALVTGDFAGKNLGDAQECLVADFDNDGLPDIVQLFVDGGLFYKGTKSGEFAAPESINVRGDQAMHAACVGDWDGAGSLDIFTCGELRNHLWHNTGIAGPNRFVDSIDTSGSVGYISKPGGDDAQTVALNDDGRQGLAIFYASGLNPQLFFNRGFRSFGLCRKLDAEWKNFPQAQEGQQAGCLGNFLGDGPPSMALVLLNGEVWFFPRKIDGKSLGVTVALSLASPTAGPVTVWVNRDQQPFGDSVIRAGDPGSFYGVTDPGPVLVSWRLPDGIVRQKQVIIDPDAMIVTPEYPNGRPLRIVIDKVQAKAGQNK